VLVFAYSCVEVATMGVEYEVALYVGASAYLRCGKEARLNAEYSVVCVSDKNNVLGSRPERCRPGQKIYPQIDVVVVAWIKVRLSGTLMMSQLPVPLWSPTHHRSSLCLR